MRKTIPKTHEIVTYERIYGKHPSPPIDLIKGMCRKSLIYEIVYINHWLNPKDKVYFNNTFATQFEILEYLTNREETKILFHQYTQRLHEIMQNQVKEKTFNIFNRATCLYALELICTSEDIKEIQNFQMDTLEKWKALTDFLLAVNWEIVERENRVLEKIHENSIESLNPVMLMINELMIESHVLFTSYRALLMIQHFLESDTYKEELISYINKNYQLHPNEFCRRILEIYMGTSSENPKLQFYYKFDDENIIIRKLSERIKNQEIYKLLNLRKSPFIQVSEKEFLLGDKIFLIEKIYSQLINDFWFDWLKPKIAINEDPKFSMKDYRGEFGRFFEKYGANLLRNTFASYRYSINLGLEELTFGKPKNEICDFYLRYGKKIILFEIKGGGIDDKSKYGGDLESLYKNNRDEFFKRYGLDQLVKALSNLTHISSEIDQKFPVGKTITVYPVIIVNEKIFQTPLMAQIFNKRFQEKISTIYITKVKIKPLGLTHISDWENVEDYLSEKPDKIWELLDYHFRNKKFIPPFFNTLNIKLPKLNKDRKTVERFLKFIKLID